MKELGVGVIGLGVGESHLATYAAHENCRVVMIADFDQDKLKELAAIYPGVEITSDAEKVLHNPAIDLVSICSYDNYHYEQTLEALRNNKHVFVEKPLCLRADESEKIRQELSRNCNLMLSSNLILRESPRFCEIRRRVKQGELGDLYYLEAAYNYGRLEKLTAGWRGDLDYYSVVLGGAVHIIDLLLWISGEEVEDVFAYGNRICSSGTKFDFNDCVVALLRFKSGVLAKITANFGCVRPHFHELNLYGTKATFVNALPEAILFESRDPACKPVLIETAYAVKSKGLLLAKFVDAILAGEVAPVTAEEIFSTLAVCFAIEESIRTQVVVPLNK